MQVFNGGNADAGPFTAGLYLSRRVDPVTHNCALDYSYPLLDAIQLATASFSGLAQGYNMPIVFPRGNTVEYWQASQWNSGRDEIFRCLFVLVNDGNSVYELQPNEEDNIASTPVRILDLVDLVPSAYAVGFSSFPWMSARVYNAGIETSPSFAVDFYQVCDLVCAPFRCCSPRRSV